MTPALQRKIPARRTRVRMTVLALVAAAALAVPAALHSLTGDRGAVTHADPELTTSIEDSADAITEAALADIQAIADGSASAMAEAGAAAEAEYAATAEQAARAVAEASSEADAAVQDAAAARARLLAAPANYEEGSEVAPSPGATEVPEYEAPTFEAEEDHRVNSSAKPYEGSDAQVKARVALGLPLTGIGAIDSATLAIVDLYLNNKHTAKDNTSIILSNGEFGTVESNGENATYSATPDDEGAQAAHEHAARILAAGNATLGSLLAGVKANVEVQAELYAMVLAEINATLAAEAEAQAAIDAAAEASIEATLAASAQAEAEAHAAAEKKMELVESARVTARQEVHQKAEQQVEVVTTAASQSQQQLQAQAEAAKAAGAQTAGQIRAAAQAAVAAVTALPGLNQTEAGARAAAIMKAAAAAEAQAWAKANATAGVLMKQSSSVAAQADLKVKAILSAEAKAIAAIDAKAEVAVRATLRAEAYTVAKVRADAEAKVKAHLNAAAAAKFKGHMAAEGHIRAVVKAAIGLRAKAAVSFDGSQDLGEQVGLHTETEASKDIQYIKDVKEDWGRSAYLDKQDKVDHWQGVEDQLTADKTVTNQLAWDVITETERGLSILAQTDEQFDALGHEYL